MGYWTFFSPTEFEVDDHLAGFHQLLGGSVGWWTKSLPWKNGCATNPAIIATPFFYTVNFQLNNDNSQIFTPEKNASIHPLKDWLASKFQVLFFGPTQKSWKELWNLTRHFCQNVTFSGIYVNLRGPLAKWCLEIVTNPTFLNHLSIVMIFIFSHFTLPGIYTWNPKQPYINGCLVKQPLFM